MSENSCCIRCGHRLKDPKSIKRGIGSICYRDSGGGTFDGDMDAVPEEWQRREQILKRGGEIDLGVNWQYPVPGDMLPANMRVSIRCNDGFFEAYGCVLKTDGNEEILFARGTDLKDIYRVAVEAGPSCTAQAYRSRVKAYREAKKSMRNAKKRVS
ncbi:MAG: hypothetical protein A4E56_00368 [Pelotomaculum sp. PtaU1.Bin065]|nr:MAG: hypothetical protein A4E56_00368 [Pelotomaculum sp. PtaU1.Bin065]